MDYALPDQKLACLPEPAPHVLIVERDDILRDMLRMTLEDAGYAVAGCADGTCACKVLQTAVHPLVVVLVHGGRDRSWDEVLSKASTLPAHMYLLLSSQHLKHLPTWRNPHTQTDVPVMTMPFASDTLLQHVAEAVGQLVTLPRQVSDGSVEI